MSNQNPFKWRHFQAEIILLCVRWYLRYALSYRDLEEMMQERGLHVDHPTIFRWVQCYAPELEKRGRPHLKACTDSWKVDETYIKVKSVWVYVPVSGCGFGREHARVSVNQEWASFLLQRRGEHCRDTRR
jgi:hypothetical protein